MKLHVIGIFFTLLILISAKAQLSKQVRIKDMPPTTEKPVTKNIANPGALVYVFSEINNNKIRFVGKLNNQTAMSIEMNDFYFNSNWKLTKEKKGSFSFIAPEEIHQISQVLICKPNGPITNPTSQNLRNLDYAAICLSNGRVIYASVSGGYRLNPKKGYETAPGSGYIQFQEEYGKGSFYQVELTWDAAVQKWFSKPGTYAGNPFLKNGATVLAVYNYSDLQTEFYDLQKTGAASKDEPGETDTDAEKADKAETDIPAKPAMAKIVFADNKEYYANIIGKQANQVDVQLIPSNDRYLINNKGIIVSSSGRYGKGARVQSVMVKQITGESIYNEINQANFNYGTLAFQFPDGKVQYAKANTVGTTFLSLNMLHSGAFYYMYYKNNEWKIDDGSGEYKNGTTIKGIFEMEQNFTRFY